MDYKGALPRLVVITVNYHSEKYLEQMIRSFDSVRLPIQFIVVDHSDSQELQYLKSPFSIRVIRQTNKGYGAGLNRGMAEVTDAWDVALLCNPDVELLDPHPLVTAIDYLIGNPNIGCLAPQLVDMNQNTIANSRRFYSPLDVLSVRIPWLRRDPPEFLRRHFYMDTNNNGPYEVDWVSGSAILCRASMYPNYCRFDERFFLYFEDVDFCAELWRRGLSVVKYPDLVFMHTAQEKSQTSVKFLFWHLISFAKFVIKHRGLPDRSTFIARGGRSLKAM